MDEKMNELFERTFADRLGATGRFPEGKLTKHDEGEIRIAVGHADEKVLIDFGKPVAWIGFNARQAREVAESLLQHAREVEARQK